MRVIVCGSRDITDVRLVRDALRAVHPRPTIVVHGGARGVDSIAGMLAKKAGVDVEVHPADWDKHGKLAGPIRNEKMATLGADLCLAIHNGSPGTADMMRRARERRIPVREVRVSASARSS